MNAHIDFIAPTGSALTLTATARIRAQRTGIRQSEIERLLALADCRQRLPGSFARLSLSASRTDELARRGLPGPELDALRRLAAILDLSSGAIVWIGHVAALQPALRAERDPETRIRSFRRNRRDWARTVARLRRDVRIHHDTTQLS